MALEDRLRDDARELAGDMTAFRHELHRRPEIGLDLPQTQRAVLGALDGLPLEISTESSCTSVTAVLRGTAPGRDPARVVLLRGDMDALPVQETTGVPFTSEIDGAMQHAPHAGRQSMPDASIALHYRQWLSNPDIAARPRRGSRAPA